MHVLYLAMEVIHTAQCDKNRLQRINASHMTYKMSTWMRCGGEHKGVKMLLNIYIEVYIKYGDSKATNPKSYQTKDNSCTKCTV